MSMATIERRVVGVIPDALADCVGEKDLWSYYKATADPSARERLILHYAPLVTRIARRIKTGLPNTIELHDLIMDGMFGLFDAIEKFDPDQGVKFETYAGQRVKGAIFDQLRKLNWVPRRVRDEIRGLDGVRRALEAALQRTPTDTEIATEAGRTVREVRDRRRSVTVLSLDAGRDGDDGDMGSLADTLADDAAGPEDAELKYDVRKAVRALPERDRIVITLYYFEGLTLAEIGRVLGLTEGRISQIKMRAAGLLRELLAAA
jgi:RNA polymerase sigma factor for flagellar operon FliA